MSIATQEKRKPLLPPDEKFWQRYSPHHEFPLAGMTSFFIHGLVIGVMVLGAFWYLFQRESESHKPPNMDVVQVTGGGDGFEGMGGQPGLPGEANSTQTELAPIPMNSVKEIVPDSDSNLKEPRRMEFDIPDVGRTDKTDLKDVLENIEKEAADRATKVNAPVKKAVSRGTTNPKGDGGLSGIGGGPGRGIKGTGSGTGGLGGRKATKAEIYAWRWRFDLSGSGREHANKLAALGVTLAIPTPDGKYLFVQDMRRRPVDLQPGNLAKFKDAVKWQNTEPGSLRDLATELKLPFVPDRVIMLLPRDREEKMASEEMRFAQKQGRPSQQILATWFDFRLRDGVYEPVAIRQQ